MIDVGVVALTERDPGSWLPSGNADIGVVGADGVVEVAVAITSKDGPDSGGGDANEEAVELLWFIGADASLLILLTHSRPLPGLVLMASVVDDRMLLVPAANNGAAAELLLVLMLPPPASGGVFVTNGDDDDVGRTLPSREEEDEDDDDDVDKCGIGGGV